MKHWLIAVLMFGGVSCAVESAPSPTDDSETAAAPTTDRQTDDRGAQPAFFRCLPPQTCSCPLNPPQLTGPVQTNGAQCGVHSVCC